MTVRSSLKNCFSAQDTKGIIEVKFETGERTFENLQKLIGEHGDVDKFLALEEAKKELLTDPNKVAPGSNPPGPQPF